MTTGRLAELRRKHDICMLSWPEEQELLDNYERLRLLLDSIRMEIGDSLGENEVATVKRPTGVPPKGGVGAIFGKWPGDETDEQIEAALKQLS